ncbi:MAG: TRIC cation channel family protein [Chloroflexi bacterium]|nr:TRIC cation channel family protein [Chloroflexota bacterium]
MFDLSQWGNFALGDFTLIDLIAATTNAFNAALLARSPSHWRQYTAVGLLLLAVVGGIAGGVSRDVLLASVPVALTNPWYLLLCLLAALGAQRIRYRTGQQLRAGRVQVMAAFALPWYAVVGADKALAAHVPFIAAVLIGVISATAGRYVLDVTAGVTPQHFVRGEWFVGTAVLASTLYVVGAVGLGLSVWPATLVAVGIAFAFRLVALRRGWEEPEPWQPAEGRTSDAARSPS